MNEFEATLAIQDHLRIIIIIKKQPFSLYSNVVFKVLNHCEYSKVPRTGASVEWAVLDMAFQWLCH